MATSSGPKIRPIRVWWQNGITRPSYDVACQAIAEAYSIVGIKDPRILTYPLLFDVKFLTGWLDNVWIDVDDALESMSDFHEKENNRFHSFIMMKDGLYRTHNGEKYVVGGTTRPHEGAVISVCNHTAQEVRLIVMHEAFHVLGLMTRTEEAVYDERCDGWHCVNRCVMRGRLSELVEAEGDGNGPLSLCKRCHSDCCQECGLNKE